MCASSSIRNFIECVCVLTLFPCEPTNTLILVATCTSIFLLFIFVYASQWRVIESHLTIVQIEHQIID